MTTTREERMRALIQERGLTLRPFGHAGAVLITGRGVYLIADSLRSISQSDIAPLQEQSHHGNKQ